MKNKNKQITLYEKWKIDSEQKGSEGLPVGFSDEKPHTQDTAKLVSDALNAIERAEVLLSKKSLSKDEIKAFNTHINDVKKVIDSLNKPRVSRKEIEENLDEGLPSESGKYDGMTYAQILQRAIESENEAIELALALLENCEPQDKEKLVEIANDENDHSQVYQGMLYRLNKN